MHWTKRADSYAQQSNAAIEGHALQALPGRAANDKWILGGHGNGLIARDGFEIVIAEFETDGHAGATLALQVLAHAHTQLGEDLRQLFTIARRVQVTLERRFSANRFRLTMSDHGPLVAAVCRVM